jgi:hypothetical protein
MMMPTQHFPTLVDDIQRRRQAEASAYRQARLVPRPARRSHPRWLRPLLRFRKAAAFGAR